MSEFASLLIAWQKKHGRRHLPWQGTRDPYRVWLSEVMLQQTQVATVIPYYERFLRRFPTVQDLASAPEDEVLRLWSGLGYYARGRNLHAAAKVIAERGFPSSSVEIEALPGVGRSTAAAIAAFAFGERAAILDGNVKRVLARSFGIEGWPGEKSVETALWSRAAALLPPRDIDVYTQALMDLGATVCTRSAPRCGNCPVRAECSARRMGRATEIPAPRPRRPMPVKCVTWLLLLNEAKVLLLKRPASGVWGGLWSFPEAPRQVSDSYIRRTFACSIRSKVTLDMREHTFTHFRLKIRPLVAQVVTGTRGAPPGHRWVQLHEATETAVPSPVRTVLTELTGRSPSR